MGRIVLKTDTNSMWIRWKELFLEVLDKHAPIRQIRERSCSVPWITADIKKLIFDRDKMKRKAMVTKQSADWDAYKTSRNRVNIALRRGKSEYYRNKNSKEAWKTINDLLGRSSSDTTINELNIDGLILLPRKKWLMDLMNILPILVLTWQVPSMTLTPRSDCSLNLPNLNWIVLSWFQ